MPVPDKKCEVVWMIGGNITIEHSPHDPDGLPAGVIEITCESGTFKVKLSIDVETAEKFAKALRNAAAGVRGM